jgi:hypothetical protein
LGVGLLDPNSGSEALQALRTVCLWYDTKDRQF